MLAHVDEAIPRVTHERGELSAIGRQARRLEEVGSVAQAKARHVGGQADLLVAVGAARPRPWQVFILRVSRAERLEVDKGLRLRDKLRDVVLANRGDGGSTFAGHQLGLEFNMERVVIARLQIDGDPGVFCLVRVHQTVEPEASPHRHRNGHRLRGRGSRGSGGRRGVVISATSRTRGEEGCRQRHYGCYLAVEKFLRHKRSIWARRIEARPGHGSHCMAKVFISPNGWGDHVWH